MPQSKPRILPQPADVNLTHCQVPVLLSAGKTKPRSFCDSGKCQSIRTVPSPFRSTEGQTDTLCASGGTEWHEMLLSSRTGNHSPGTYGQKRPWDLYEKTKTVLCSAKSCCPIAPVLTATTHTDCTPLSLSIEQHLRLAGSCAVY